MLAADKSTVMTLFEGEIFIRILSSENLVKTQKVIVMSVIDREDTFWWELHAWLVKGLSRSTRDVVAKQSTPEGAPFTCKCYVNTVLDHSCLEITLITILEK